MFCGDKTDVSAAVICPVSTADICAVSMLPPAAPGCCRLTQAMKSKLVDHFLLEKLKVFCPIPFIEDDINSDSIFTRNSVYNWHRPLG